MVDAGKVLEAMGFSPTTRYYEQVGWRGCNPITNDYFRCEFCDAESTDCTKIEHADSCPVTMARVVVGNEEPRQPKKEQVDG